MKKQKTAAAALAMAIALTGLTACGSNNNAENNAGAANTGAANTGAATEPAANTAANTGAADKAGADAANMPEKPAELTIWPDDNADSVATITDITKKYTEKTGIKVNVKPVKMNDQQQILSLDGPAGKGPDLFYQPGIGNLVLKGLVQPVEGSIAVDGLSPEKDGDEVRRSCGTLTEQPGLYDDMTGRENLRFYASLYGIHGLDRIQELSGVLSLQEFLDRKTGTYSTGMKKRLGLARAMLHKPSVLLLDEPTNGLDPDGTRDVLLYLKRLNEHEGVTVLICSHVLSQLETVCSSYIFLEQGAKKAEGTLQELRKRYISTLQLEIRVRDWQGRNGNIQIEAESYEALPGLLRSISAQSRLYEARILNDDLQSIYFQIRKENLP